MLRCTSDMDQALLEVTLDGGMTTEEYEKVVAAVDALLTRHDKINVIGIVHDFGWVEPEVWWKDLQFHLGHRHVFRRAAIVTDRPWIGSLTRLVAPMYSYDVRTFDEADIAAARAWATAPDAPAAG